MKANGLQTGPYFQEEEEVYFILRSLPNISLKVNEDILYFHVLLHIALVVLSSLSLLSEFQTSVLI